MTIEDLILLFIAAITLHIFADFHLQGLLADLKQKKWWLDNVFSKGFNHKYDKDYVAALFIHALEWSILVHIPALVMIYYLVGISTPISIVLLVSILLQAILHAAIDDLKCNRYKLNLIQDQILHILQLIMIFLTYLVAATSF